MFIWKIAWRNVLRHKGKTIVVGIILAFGMLIMTIGNAVMEGAKDGLNENVIQRFSGEAVAVSDIYKGRDVFMAPHSVKLIRNYIEVKGVLKNLNIVEQFFPMARGQVTILNDAGITGHAYFLGVQFEEYQKFSNNNVVALEGELLTNRARGVLISDETRKKIFDRQKFWLVPEGTALNVEHLTPEAKKMHDAGRLIVKHELVIVGQSDDSLETDICAPVRGIFQFQQLNKFWASYINFMDLESYRQTFGHLTAGDRSAELSEEQKATLAIDDADAIFADSDMTTVVPTHAETITPDVKRQEEQKTIAAEIDLEDGIFSMVMMKFKPGITPEQGLTQVREAMNAANLGIRVMSWQEALGELADIATIMQGLLFLFVMFIFFVAIVIIMNTLSMAALERTSEIGMMRAIGAQKGFISRMFLMETAQIALVFGLAGIVVGLVCVGALAVFDISVANSAYISVMAGGNTLHASVSAVGIILGVAQLIIVTLLASLYPMRVATKITPLEAISRD